MPRLEQRPGPPDADHPADEQEAREEQRLTAEVVGTYFLVMAAAGADIVTDQRRCLDAARR